jgi:hypothetical protein
MPVALPEPDGEREGIPLWLCPNCDRSSRWKPTAGTCARIFAPASKSGSSKAGAIAASMQKSKAVN